MKDVLTNCVILWWMSCSLLPSGESWDEGAVHIAPPQGLPGWSMLQDSVWWVYSHNVLDNLGCGMQISSQVEPCLKVWSIATYLLVLGNVLWLLLCFWCPCCSYCIWFVSDPTSAARSTFLHKVGTATCSRGWGGGESYDCESSLFLIAFISITQHRQMVNNVFCVCVFLVQIHKRSVSRASREHQTHCAR